MSRFVLEALFIGVKEGAKLALCAFLLCSFFRGRRLDYLKAPMTAAFVVVFAASFAVMRAPVTPAFRDIIVRMTGYVFGLFSLISLGALYHTTGTDMLGPLRRLRESRPVLGTIAFLLTVVYFVPDMAGASLYVSDLFSMAGRTMPVSLAAATGFAGMLAAGYLLSRRFPLDVTRIFGAPQLLLFLALVKLLAGGVRGFTELSLIPSVQSGLMKLVHDVVHQAFVIIMVPDHMILTTTAWNFIGVLFGPTVGLWLSLLIITVPLMIFLVKHFTGEIAVPGEIAVAARKRSFIRAIRDQRVLKSLPVLLFLAVIAATWFAHSGEALARLYLPEPKPAVAEQERVVIPLQSPGEDLRDGAIHKFSVTLGGEAVRLLIMKKPDGTLAVCLDACEICSPDGYGQTDEHVICIYCNTPIPFDTVGKPGGCNPVPLEALVTEKDVRIQLAEISNKWALVKSGASQGAGER